MDEETKGINDRFRENQIYWIWEESNGVKRIRWKKQKNINLVIKGSINIKRRVNKWER